MKLEITHKRVKELGNDSEAYENLFLWWDGGKYVWHLSDLSDVLEDTDEIVTLESDGLSFAGKREFVRGFESVCDETEFSKPWKNCVNMDWFVDDVPPYEMGVLWANKNK